MGYYDYEKYYDKPSEANGIINEATEKLRELIKKPIKEEIEANNKAKAELDIKNREISDKLLELKLMEEKINNKENELKNIEDNIPLDILNKMIKSIGGDITIGQEVWIIVGKSSKFVCPKCQGSKKYEAHYTNGLIEEKNCDCYTGEVLIEEWYPVKDIVERVNIRIDFAKDGVKIQAYNWVDVLITYIQLKKYGYISSFENIFLTQEEAQIAANKKNENERKRWSI